MERQAYKMHYMNVCRSCCQLFTVRFLTVLIYGFLASSCVQAQTGAPAEHVAALERAQLGIEAYRKGDWVLVVRNAAGEALAGVSVKAELQRHAFLFGANLGMLAKSGHTKWNEAYAEQFAALFNYGTLPVFWRLAEREPGVRDFSWQDAVCDWAKAHGIALKGHTLLYDHEAGIPAWSKVQRPVAEQEAWVRAVLAHFGERVGRWEVVNEPCHLRGIPLLPAHGWVREQAPWVKICVNEYGVEHDGYPAFHRFLEEALAQGVPFDIVGIQAHEPRTEAFSLDRLQGYLDKYASLGKAIHITEFMAPSGGMPLTGARWRGQWNEETQAQYVEDFYTVCFGHPAVEAISWWDFSDEGAWVPHTGLIRADASPKPAYERLRRLIHETWTTRASGKTDEKGEFRFRGFFGEYAVSVAGVENVARLSLEERTDEKYEIRVTL